MGKFKFKTELYPAKKSAKLSAGRSNRNPSGTFFYTFFTLRVFFYIYFLLLFFYYLPSSLLRSLTPFIYFLCVFFLFILLVGSQPALLGVLNTESSTQASGPTRNKFVCVCVCVCISTDIWKGGGFLSIPYIGTGPGLEP